MAFVPDDVTWKHKVSMHDVRGQKGKSRQQEEKNNVVLIYFTISLIVSGEILHNTITNVLFFSSYFKYLS